MSDIDSILPAYYGDRIPAGVQAEITVWCAKQGYTAPDLQEALLQFRLYDSKGEFMPNLRRLLPYFVPHKKPFCRDFMGIKIDDQHVYWFVGRCLSDRRSHPRSERPLHCFGVTINPGDEWGGADWDMALKVLYAYISQPGQLWDNKNAFDILKRFREKWTRGDYSGIWDKAMKGKQERFAGENPERYPEHEIAKEVKPPVTSKPLPVATESNHDEDLF
jgi:hypothetical protein